MLIKQLTLIFFLSSCALFRSEPSLKNQKPEKLLESIQLTGEGTGRLTLGQNQYVFSIDSVLKENTDWILAVSIPMRGEEVMILPNLKKVKSDHEEIDTFEARIENEFKRLELHKKLTAKQFLKELRSLIRFHLSPSWGQKRVCKAQQTDLVCEQDGEKFLIVVEEKEINTIKLLDNENRLHLVAKNLTRSFFAQTDIRLYSNEANSKKKSSFFSLELFWKN